MRMKTVISVVLILIAGLVAALPTASGAADPEVMRSIEGKLETWDVEGAWTEVQGLLSRDSKDLQVLEVASHIAFYQGRYEEALRYAKSALDIGGEGEGRKGFALLVEATLGVVRNYKRHETPHFVILLDERQDGILADYFTEALEKMYRAMAEQYGFRPTEKVRVEVYPDTKAFYYTSTLSARDIEVTGAVGLTKFNKLMLLSPRALVQGYRWLDAICHEYMHYLINKLTANKAPIWFHEGLADYEEARWRDAPRQLSPVHQALLARALSDGRLISFERMEPGLVKLETPEAVQLAYAEASSAIEFIIARGGHTGLQEIMKQMATGNEKGAGEAIKASLGWSFEEFEAKWKEFLASKGLKEVDGVMVRRYKIKEGLADDDRMEMREIRSMVARNRAHLGDLLRERGRMEAAVLEYRRALADTQGSVPIMNRLSDALIHLGRYEESLEHLHRARELSPDHPATYASLGKIYLAQKNLEKAQEAFRNAIEINPFNPEVHRDLALVYEMAGDNEAALKEREIFNKLNK
jgi:tetratricopeptide (TPR) repeat protein